MDVEAVVKKVEQTIESCSQQDVELHIERVGLSSALSDHTTDKQTDRHAHGGRTAVNQRSYWFKDISLRLLLTAFSFWNCGTFRSA